MAKNFISYHLTIRYEQGLAAIPLRDGICERGREGGGGGGRGGGGEGRGERDTHTHSV